MPFDVTQPKERKEFKKTEYLYFDLGQHIVRLLDDPSKERKVYTHYLPSTRMTLLCLEDDCPLCQNNRKIFLENPKTFRTIAGYNPRSPKHLLNALDRTLVKTCPKCQYEAKRGVDFQFPSACPKCSTFITAETPHPSNKVKVVSLSDTVASQLNMYEQSMLDTSGEPLPITSYDLMFMVTKVTDKKITAPSPLTQNNDVLDIPVDSKYDLNNAVMRLEAGEINELLRGVSLRDIFAARKTDAVEKELVEETKEVSEDIKNKVSALFED